ncbi:MAG: PaaI family thioesterase [Thermoleophilia bacterium]
MNQERKVVDTAIPNPFRTADCFCCGPDNPDSLNLVFHWNEERREVSTRYVPTRRFAGQGDILHGALQMGLLDETMGWTAVHVSGSMAVTVQLTTTFHSPAYIRGTPLMVTSRVRDVDGRSICLEAEITDSDGVLCTTGEATFRLLSDERFDKIVHWRPDAAPTDQV